MIEMRIIDNGLGCQPEIQYRYKLPEDEQWMGADWKLVEWSGWETAEILKAEDTEE